MPSKEMQEIQKRWNDKYGHLSLEDREALIKKETEEGLRRLKDAGIVPTMTADELMKLTRDR
ncbi:hypothetical protein EVB32_039 [Rhizobium phage RHph_TM39]|uniref:Uncharacterized protein n=1 Tax=Rhizobium phage RHph_TM30 TaxID=2509764 RepID=A0A7S5R9B3_9CAUD|nr:hypothetical protein PQC16_gp039 [Rhizobium phage RHph_TM30]QIG71510.1 hypothetical protein EVB94_039 [Rhizobium phage RHph_TM40]QIG71873.1 hypothetical protein EVB95_039 [Rhizobium phage RHph_TM2_3B]QIG72235.1 hypothetical protein EVB96_039 [Rhizobium phage RHph_TM3_3_6]QIG77027.1 hypothetical protein EVB32_039 [Rhizobium phage RHph_TM39]QIG77367.1 hypothetical protein EVB61_039 [Rhizobium phage RHph_TM21B]QIG77626.1 hypothetical protein EVB64_039 [Rhizobium phage RHph_TM61]